MLDNAGLAIQGKPETIAAAEVWVGLLTSGADRGPAVSSSALEHEASV